MSMIVKLGKKAKGILKSAGFFEKEHRVTYVRRVERIRTDKRICAMTFDDGPMALPASPDSLGGKSMTAHLLDTFRKYGAHATFDVIGDTGENYPDVCGKVGGPAWGGTAFDHYPDFEKDSFGGAVHAPGLVRRMLDEGHELSNHGYRHIIFGKKPFVYGKREYLGSLDKTVEDLERLHRFVKENFGYEMKLSRPPHYVDRIDRHFTSYDAYALMGYTYMAASYDGGGWLPSSAEDAENAEVSEMAALIENRLGEDPDFFRGQIIFQKDGYNMAKRTPIAYALDAQLRLLTEYGYKVVPVGELLAESPFADVGRECDIFEKLVSLSKDRAVAFDDNTVRLEKTMTNYELAMLLCPKEVAVNERIESIKKTGRFLSEYDAALRYAKEKGYTAKDKKGKDPVTVFPGGKEKAQGYTRYEVYGNIETK